jgi:dihydroorotate dehydrogenase electron transfer subunit
MDNISVNLSEIFQLGLEIAGALDLPRKYWPQPGQYLPCQRVDDAMDGLPTHLFRVMGVSDGLNLAPIPEAWSPGDHLVCTQPQGHGFALPRAAQRVGLIPFKVSPSRLLSLAGAALSQTAAVSLFYDPPPSIGWLERVPSQVEVLPLAALGENPDWPDYLAVDLNRSAIPEFMDRINMRDLHCGGQVLVRTDMPCRGLGACGVCAVHTRRGWRYACVDGPVFPLEEVLHVAG